MQTVKHPTQNNMNNEKRTLKRQPTKAKQTKKNKTNGKMQQAEPDVGR